MKYRNSLDLDIEIMAWDLSGGVYDYYGFIRGGIFGLYINSKCIYLETLPPNTLENFLKCNGFKHASFDLINTDGIAIYHGLNTSQFVNVLKKINGYKY